MLVCVCVVVMCPRSILLGNAVFFFNTFCYQENIPTATAEKVKAGMLGGVEAALGLPKGSLQKPFYTRVQLW